MAKSMASVIPGRGKDATKSFQHREGGSLRRSCNLVQQRSDGVPRITRRDALVLEKASSSIEPVPRSNAIKWKEEWIVRYRSSLGIPDLGMIIQGIENGGAGPVDQT
jgi:hypothetical protein